MTGLERQAHRLVELGRAGADPSAANLMSLHGAVAARIAAEGAASLVPMAVATKATSAGAFVNWFVVVAAVGIGAGGVLALTPESGGGAQPAELGSRVSASSVPVQAPVLQSTSARVEALAAASAPVVDAPGRVVRATKAFSQLRLQDEAALLSEVQGALRAGKAGLALSKLESYDRGFPAGMLRAEADAARVFAHCSAGHVEKARSAAARFVQRYPNAPATARVQGACR